MKNKQIYIASDHRGVALKGLLCDWLKEHGYDFTDFGPADASVRVHASNYAIKVVDKMRDEPDSLAVLICGTGQVMAMTSNRYRHIRAALCMNSLMAKMARGHNDANILVLGSEIVGRELAFDCLEAFLTTEVLGGRYAERRELLANLGGL